MACVVSEHLVTWVGMEGIREVRVPQGAVFLAEMLSPIAANPLYWSGPLFAGVLYGFIYGFDMGVVAAVVVGIPVTLATACVGKAVEIAVVL